MNLRMDENDITGCGRVEIALPGGVTTYFLQEYSEELAGENEIISQDTEFSYGYCIDLCDTVWGERSRKKGLRFTQAFLLPGFC